MSDSITAAEDLRAEGENEQTQTEESEEVGRWQVGSPDRHQAHEGRLQSQPEDCEEGGGKGDADVLKALLHW